MKWRGRRESHNVEDRRGRSFGGKSVGIGALVVALAASYFLGVDPALILGLVEQNNPAASQEQNQVPANDPMSQFVRVVLADTEDAWQGVFQQHGRDYRPPTLVLFSGSTPTACGHGQAAAGPFYCPPDEKVYIDLSFYQMMKDRFQAPGDFAQAYVIAHEVGHHVQNLLGVMNQIDAARGRVSQAEQNQLSVRLELQADCLAGVWANRTQRQTEFLEEGDVEEALAAAAAIGDDNLQKQSRGYVVPESFTHGTSAQRTRWFKRGLDGGDLAACNTFEAAQL